MDKLKMHSPNFVNQNIAKIAELFPSCVTESHNAQGELQYAIDFDLLKQELSAQIVEGPQERYQLNWPGKREALLTANAPIAKTLRPCREESVDFDTTQNLFIEGDNLDALKLLQETYLGKVKMIYVDPPYNRKKGNDLVYRDDFAGNSFEYLKKTNQLDEEGSRLVSNSEYNGRFHSDWLSMIYMRLKLSKSLMTNDGVILISIDDNESSNLLKVCDEVFGEDNFVGSIIWKNVTDNNPTNIAIEHENIHVYARSKVELEGVWKSKLSDIKDVLVRLGEELTREIHDLDELQAEYSRWFKEHKNQLGPLDRYKYIDFDGIYTGSQSVHNPGREGYRYDVVHPVTQKPCKQPLMGYRFPESTMKTLLDDGKILFGDDHTKIIELKVYAKDYVDKLSSVFELDGRTGPYDLKILFPEATKVFSNPKPVILLEKYLSFILSEKAVALDLFAGSATLSHALMKLNALDMGNRRYIAIQYPEPISGDSKDSKLALSFCKKLRLRELITEISKERIRRAGKKIKEENADKEGIEDLDIGFRVLKVDTSNMAEVYYNPAAVSQDDLFNQVDNVKPDRDDEDLLFQVMLDWGVDLTLPIRRETIQGKTVFFVDKNALLACFNKQGGIDDAFVKELATHQPVRAVFRDAGFKDDSAKINVEQVFKLLSPVTTVKSL